MDESLKELQLMLRSLIAISAALLLFVVSADRRPGPYQAALVEFTTLKTLMPEVEKTRVSEESSVYSNSQLGIALRQEAARQHIQADHVEFVGAIEKDEMQFSPPMYFANSSQKIDDLYNYIKTAPGFDTFPLYQFSDSELRGAIAELLQRSGGAPISKVYFGLYVDTTGPKFKQVQGQCTLSIPSSGIATDQPKPIQCHSEKAVHFDRAVGMLRSAKLFEEQNGYILALPALSRVWDDVAGKEMNNVQGILERKAAAEISSQTGTVSVLGLSLNASAIGFAGPSLELLIVFYLLALLIHIGSLKETALDAVRSFPEVGISRGVIGTIVTGCVVLIFPLIAGNTVIVQFFSYPKPRMILVPFFSVCYLLPALWSVTLLKKLRT